jgi:hypothetical protein
MTEPRDGRLDSWKAIAAHFNRDVRTVRRWEQVEGMPVHRHSHSKLASVYAYRDELDRWSAGRAKTETAVPEPSRFSRFIVVALALLALGALATGVVLWRSGGSARAVTIPPPVSIASRIFAATEGEGQAPRYIPLEGLVGALAISPDGRELIGLDFGRNAIQFIDTATERVAHVLPLGGEPGRMVMSPDGGWIYVALRNAVVRVNRLARTLQTIVREIDQPSSLALTGDGRRLYIAAGFQGLRVVDLHTGTVSMVPTVKCPMEVVTIPYRDLLYVGYQCGGPGGRDGHDAMDVRTASTGALITTIVGPPQVSSDMVVSPDGAQVWIDGHDACSVPRYDHAGCPQVPGGVLHAYRTDDHLKLGTFGTSHEDQPEGLAFLADSSRLVASGAHTQVFDTTRMSLVERSSRGTRGQVVFTPDGRRAFAVVDGHRRLAIYDLTGDACLAAPNGLIAWWSGDGHSGDIKRDSHGHAEGGAGFAAGYTGQAFSFDGVDDSIRVPMVTSFWPPDVTMALVAKPRTTGKEEILLSGFKNVWQIRRLASGQIDYCVSDVDGQCGDAGRATSQTPVAENVWTEVVVVDTTDTLSIYINGKLDATGPASRRPYTDRYQVRIGASFSGSGFFSGLIDEVRFFNAALDASEIARMQSAGRPGLCVK